MSRRRHDAVVAALNERWRIAVDMAANAEIDRDEARAAYHAAEQGHEREIDGILTRIDAARDYVLDARGGDVEAEEETD